MFKRISSQKCIHWNKIPFDIGYPILGPELQKEKQRISKFLFGSESIDYINTDTSIYKEFVYDQPKKLHGYDLFSHEAQLVAKQKHPRIWKELPEEKRSLFNSMSNDIYIHQLRLWRGYEIVEYLKRYELNYSFNPYPLLGLYPWEVIKDKLRTERPKYDFEVDFYDRLIDETFNRRVKRATSLYAARNDKGRYDKLPMDEKSWYEHFAERRKDLITNMVREPQYISTYLKFYQQNYRNYKPTEEDLLKVTQDGLSPKQQNVAATSTAAMLHWKRLTDSEKACYGSDKRIFSHKYKEEIIDWKLSAVMDYIYKVGFVKNSPTDYDWRSDYKHELGSLHYLAKSYTQRLVYIENGTLHIDTL